MARVFIHILTFNSGPQVEACIRSALRQNGFDNPSHIRVHVTDNGSEATSQAQVRSICNTIKDPRLSSEFLPHNLGFCGGHNRGLWHFLQRDYEYVLILNPDVALREDCVARLVDGLQRHPECGTACGKLLRANTDLSPLDPPQIDSTGMVLERSARHFDRGHGELDSTARYGTEEPVFGGTGACLLMRRDFVASAAVADARYETTVDRLYPQLAEGRSERTLLFDEAFFAYREDAELAWRARNLGWGCWYLPSAIAYHVRVVTPERRRSLPPELNLYSVRNRFLMQIVNFRWDIDRDLVLPGLILRNLIVVAGIFIAEWRSLPALWHVIILMKRAVERRRLFQARRKMRKPDA